MKTTSDTNQDGVIQIERTISASPREIFVAFEQSDKLARWWGPAGFTNTFELCEFKTGGSWIYVMHGPNGQDYPNECVFSKIEPDTKIVIEHVVLPYYMLTLTLTESVHGTHLTWRQEFQNSAFVASMRDFLENANNENLDRLEAVLAESAE